MMKKYYIHYHKAGAKVPRSKMKVVIVSGVNKKSARNKLMKRLGSTYTIAKIVQK